MANPTTKKIPTSPETDLSGNGKIFKELSAGLSRVLNASDDFANVFGEALAKKIWLGFIHPLTGEICSFIYRDDSGAIDEALSFKMWVATGQEKGGLGIDNFGLIENLLKGSKCFPQVIPLLIDAKGLQQANNIRESQGQPPLLSMSKSKEFYLKRITESPNPTFCQMYQRGVPFSIVGKAANSYLRLNSKEKLNIDLHLAEIAKEQVNTAVSNKLAELFELDITKTVAFHSRDPYLSAKKLVDCVHREGCDNEYLETFIKHIQALSKSEG